MKSKSELNMEIERLENKLESIGKMLDDIPRPAQWLEEDCEDSSKDIVENNFAEINEKMNRLREVLK